MVFTIFILNQQFYWRKQLFDLYWYFFNECISILQIHRFLDKKLFFWRHSVVIKHLKHVWKVWKLDWLKMDIWTKKEERNQSASTQNPTVQHTGRLCCAFCRCWLLMLPPRKPTRIDHHFYLPTRSDCHCWLGEKKALLASAEPFQDPSYWILQVRREFHLFLSMSHGISEHFVI